MKVFWSHRRATFKKVTCFSPEDTIWIQPQTSHTLYCSKYFFKSIETSFIDLFFSNFRLWHTRGHTCSLGWKCLYIFVYYLEVENLFIQSWCLRHKFLESLNHIKFLQSINHWFARVIQHNSPCSTFINSKESRLEF